MKDVFIFSGTTEGRTLSRWLASNGVQVHVRVATEFGAEVMENSDNIDVKVGSCGGAEGMAEIIRNNMFDLVIDATHPYATTVSRHIREACEATGAECMRIIRTGTGAEMSDVIAVDSVRRAVDYLSDKEGVILAATGSNEISEYTRIPDYRERVVARVLSTASSMQKCTEAGFEGRNLICSMGPYSEEVNYATLKQIGARYMVTKDSGTVGGFEEKVRAARRAGVRIVLISKPDETGVTYDEAVRILEERFGIRRDNAPPAEGKRTVTIIGIGVGDDGMTERAAAKLRTADVVIGAKRMLESVDTSGRDVLQEYRSDAISGYLDGSGHRSAAVLMSGDVGFYSGTKKLLKALDPEKYDVDVECGTSSLSYLCAKMGTTWQDAYLASAHGKKANLVGICSTHAKVFTLLEGEESVHRMCRELFDFGLNGLTVTVGQNFGMEGEKIVSGTPSEMLDTDFGELCVAMIENPEPDLRTTRTVPDDMFLRGDAPMTKSEVRTLSVQKLWLNDDSIIYDIGAGTGSVTVEMAMAACNGTVYAIEKEDAAADLIEMNKKKFRVPNIQVVRGLAPEALADLPAPTHAFIGGSSGNLKQILQTLLDKNPDIRVIVNSVTMETAAEIMDCIRDLGLVEEETVQINVAKAKKAGRYHLMTAQNPVYITVVRGR